MEVPCPLCKNPLTGKTADEILDDAKSHVNEVHQPKELERVLSHVRGIIRNLPTNA
jgi:hypothetical protein